MAAPVMTKATVGNLVAAVSLPASKQVAVYRDDSANIEDQVTCRFSTGGAVAATAGCRIDVFGVYGSTTINFSGGYAAGATSIIVTSATGLSAGMKICVGPDGTNGGEIRTISGISGTTLTIDALQYAHANSAAVYIITQTARPSTTLGQPTTAANTAYSDLIRLGTGVWIVVLTNLDATNAITVEMANGIISAFA